MEQTTAAPPPGAGRRTTSVEQRPNDAQQVGAHQHPLELRRVLAGYQSRDGLATAAGISRQAVDKIVNGDTIKPRAATAAPLAVALDIPLTVLLHELHSPQSGVTTEQPRVVSPEGDAGQEATR